MPSFCAEEISPCENPSAGGNTNSRSKKIGRSSARAKVIIESGQTIEDAKEKLPKTLSDKAKRTFCRRNMRMELMDNTKNNKLPASSFEPSSGSTRKKRSDNQDKPRRMMTSETVVAPPGSELLMDLHIEDFQFTGGTSNGFFNFSAQHVASLWHCFLQKTSSF